MMLSSGSEVIEMWTSINTRAPVSIQEMIIWLHKYIFMHGLSLTWEFSIDHDIQVFLWVSADVPGDGVETNGGILQRETHSWAIEPRQTPEEQKPTFIPIGLDDGGPLNRIMRWLKPWSPRIR